MHTLVCKMFKWNYEQLLYGQTFLPTDIRFARANAPLIECIGGKSKINLTTLFWHTCSFFRNVFVSPDSHDTGKIIVHSPITLHHLYILYLCTLRNGTSIGAMKSRARSYRHISTAFH